MTSWYRTAIWGLLKSGRGVGGRPGKYAERLRQSGASRADRASPGPVPAGIRGRAARRGDCDNREPTAPSGQAWVRRSLIVLVVAAEKVERVFRATRLVAPARRPVKPLVHAPQAVEPARIGRVGVVHDAVLNRERAHARDRKSTRLNSSHIPLSRMPSSA